jgi:hypothetical protein
MQPPLQYALSECRPCRGATVDRGQRVSRVAGDSATAFLGLTLALAGSSATAQGPGPLSYEPPMPTSEAQWVLPERTEPLGPNVIAAKPVWRRLTLGVHRSVDRVRQALDAAHVRVGDWADEILGRPAFVFSQTRKDVELVIVRVSELGFVRSASLSDIHRRANELGLELCPAEVAPLLRLEYANQPLGEVLNIAMQPIATYGGELITLSIANAGTGPLLIGGEARADLSVHPQTSFVFVRPQRIALPDLR